MKWHKPHKKKKKGKRGNKSQKSIMHNTINKKHINRRSAETPQKTISPLKDFSRFFENSIRRKFKPTFEIINEFLKGGQYNIDLNYDSIDDGKRQATFPLRINQSNHRGVNFKITLPYDFVCKNAMHKDSYGLDESLKIYNKKSTFFIEKGSIINFRTTYPYRPLSIKGDFTRIRTFEKLEHLTYLRCLIPTSDQDMIFPGYFLHSDSKSILFDIESLSLHRNNITGIPMPSIEGHYFELNINGCKILFYGIEIKNYRCLVIDSLEKIGIDDFEKIVYAIRLVYSFFTGRYYKDAKIILSSNESEFERIEHLSYQMEKESIITDFQIVDFELFYQIIEHEEIKEEYNKYRKHIEPETFSSMCNMVLSSGEFKRVLELITSAGKNNNPIIQGALYSVALETLTKIIYDENAETLYPIPKIIFKELRNTFLKILSSDYADKIDMQGQRIIKLKIENMNTPTNRDKLEKPFELVGIALSEEERIIINTRNKYLHGEEPENSYEWFLKKQLNALNLLDLTARLILKYFKYEGHYFSPQFKYVLNNDLAKEIIHKEFDPRKYGNILEKLSKKEFTKVEEIEEAKAYLEEFIPFANIISVLGQKIKLI